METLSKLLDAQDAVPSPQDASRLADRIGEWAGGVVYPGSITARAGALFALVRSGLDKQLCIITRPACPQAAAGFQGTSRTVRADGAELLVTLAPTSHTNAEALRQALPFTRPSPIGLCRSIGFGDRLGLATPGHIRAVRGSGCAAYFAQQSIREMTRTRRTPDEVMDAASWGVLQEGWREPFGADADHLKTTDDIDACLEAGFVFFTIDPGDHVNDQADRLEGPALTEQFEALPWDELETSARDCVRRYTQQACAVGPALQIRFTEQIVARAAVKYARCVAHTVRMYRHLAGRVRGRPFELEVSVDETATPTSIPEHYFVAAELKRLGVRWISLAPRFVGQFEKGVDYKGDLGEFERTFADHVAIARHLGPYKISIHSGSDKFSIYPIAARLADELIHVKTAGTSYLEALRAVAGMEPALFREILAFAFERYEQDKASYHVSAEVNRVPRPDGLKDDELATVLDSFDGRQMLHVTFGSVLTSTAPDGSSRFRERLLQALRRNEEAHYEALRVHLGKHVDPFRKHP